MKNTAALHILLLGTMSSGKSTLVNALLGSDMMPTANAATTTKIFRLHSRENIQRGKLWEIASYRELSREDINKYNKSPGDETITLLCNFPYMCHHKADIFLYDTPGPNTAIYSEHKNTLMDCIQKLNFSHIICIINAKETETDGEEQCLDNFVAVAQSKNKDARTIFVLNKVDELDEARDGPLQEFVASTAEWLQKKGFSSPVVVPVMAKAAFLLRANSNQSKLSKDEYRAIRNFELLLNDRKEELMAASNICLEWREEIVRWSGYSRTPVFRHYRFSELAEATVGRLLNMLQGRHSRLVRETGIRTLELLLEREIYINLQTSET